MIDSLYTHFSTHEYNRRNDLVRAWMADIGVEALLIYGCSYGGDHIRWLTGFPPRHDTFLIWPLHAPPTLLVQLFNHVPNAREIAVIDDVRWGGPDSAETAADVLRAIGGNGNVGLIGRIPYQAYKTLSQALPEATYRDVGGAYAVLRLVKSAEEIAWLRRGAAFTDAAMRALAQTAGIGVSESELVTAIEGSYTAVGGQHGIHFLSTASMKQPDSYVPRQNQGNRQLSSGDVIICELSAGVGGYNGQIHRPLAIGQPPTARYQHLYDVATEAYERIVDTLRPGNTLKEALDAADLIADQGLSVCDDLLHGYGAGYLAPVARTRQTAHRKQAPETFEFKKNMAIVVQPNVIDETAHAGLQVGNLLLITENGAECLHSYPLEFNVIDQ